MAMWYFFVGSFWALFASQMQWHRSNNSTDKMALCYILNFFAWPIGMIVALFKLLKNLIGK